MPAGLDNPSPLAAHWPTPPSGFAPAQQGSEIGSDGPERLGRGQAGGADGGHQPGRGADEQRGAQAARPGLDGDDDGPALGVRVDGGGRGARVTPAAPPARTSSIASARNWTRIWPRVAPR